MSNKTVLVIGGGAAGHQIAYRLQNHCNVVLVEPKTYWEVPMALPRLLVEPEALAARIPYDRFLRRTRHVLGKVTGLADGQAAVSLNDGSEEVVHWDYAVVASGSVTMDPLMKAQALSEIERASEIAAMHGKLRQARAVVIAGGGPVGVEIAAELRETFPALGVTLVHGGERLLDRAPGKFAGWAEDSLRASGVTLVLGDLVTSPIPGAQPTEAIVATRNGKRIPADVMIWAGGVTAVTDFVTRSWPDAVAANGQLKVDAYLRLEGHPRVFVAGDVTNLPEGRLAIIGGLHAKSVAANLRAVVAAADPSAVKLKPYRPAPPGKGMGKMMVVTLGRRDGLTSLPFGQFRAGFLARKIKSRDMLVGMSRKAVAIPA